MEVIRIFILYFDVMVFRKRSVERAMFYNASPEIFKRARELRENLTPTENMLWSHLQKGKMMGYRFKSQHPIDNFIVDFYCHRARLVIEIDGEVHQEEDQVERDQGRTAELEHYGLTILRFTNQDVVKSIDNVLLEIKNKLLQHD